MSMMNAVPLPQLPRNFDNMSVRDKINQAAEFFIKCVYSKIGYTADDFDELVNDNTRQTVVVPVSLGEAKQNSKGEWKKNVKALIGWNDTHSPKTSSECFETMDEDSDLYYNAVGLALNDVFTIIDFDSRDVFDELADEHPEILRHLRVETNKGFHVYFKKCNRTEYARDDTNSYRSVSVDIKSSNNAFILCPPSQYKIDNNFFTYKAANLKSGVIEEIPEWLHSWLQSHREEKRTRQITDFCQADVMPQFTVSSSDNWESVKNKCKNEDDKSYLGYLMTIHKNCSHVLSDYGTWLDVFSVGKSKCSENYALVDAIMQKFDKYNRDGNLSSWACLQTTGKVKGWTTLINILKNSNVSKSEIVKQMKEVGCDYYATADYVFTDLEAAQQVVELHKKQWKFCDGTLYVFDDEVGMWSDDKTTHFKVISKYADKLKVATMEKDEIKVSAKRSYGSNKSLMDKVLALIPQLVIDNAWLQNNQNSSLGKILFKNGYVDKDGFHREFDSNIVFFYRIEMNYVEVANTEINKVLKNLFQMPLGDEQGIYFVRNIAMGLFGQKMKRILFGIGVSNSGKSMITQAILNACGQYSSAFDAAAFACRMSNGDEAKNNRWAMLKQHKRIILSNELTMNAKLDGNIIKKHTGGDMIEGRMHGGNETLFDPHYLPIVFANDMPAITPYDAALKFRCKVLNFAKAFVDTPEENNETQLQKDPKIGNTIKTESYKMALLNLLVREYRNVVSEFNGNVPEPAIIEENQNAWIDAVADPLDPILERIEITNNVNDYVESSSLDNIIIECFNGKETGISMKKFGMLLKNYCRAKGYNNVESKDKKVQGRNKKCWFGIKFIQVAENKKD